MSLTTMSRSSHRPPSRRKRGRDPFGDDRLNEHLTRITEADRLHPHIDPAVAFDIELRAAFCDYPTGEGMRRVLTCARILRGNDTAPHLTDEHLRRLWRERRRDKC